MKLRNLIFLLLVILFSSACQKKAPTYQQYKVVKDASKPLSWGQDQVIYTFIDDGPWKTNEGILRGNLERYQYTTDNESYFELKRGDVSALEQFKKFRNLVFCASLSSIDPVSMFVKAILSDTYTNQVKKNRVAMFVKSNLWANDQTVVFVIADTDKHLLAFNYLSQNQLFGVFLDRLYQRLAQKAYDVPVLDDVIFADYPFTLKIPNNYRVYRNEQKSHFISFIYRSPQETREQPDKYVAVYYEAMPTNQVDQEWLIKTRREMAWKHYDQDEFSKKDIRVEKADFNGTPAWKISGKWQNKKYAIGGAFQSYAIYDAKHKMAYLIDNSVFFPAGDKLSHLLELDAIGKSLQIK